MQLWHIINLQVPTSLLECRVFLVVVGKYVMQYLSQRLDLDLLRPVVYVNVCPDSELQIL